MAKTLWIRRQGHQYVIAPGEPDTAGRGSVVANWDSVSYRLSTLEFSESAIQVAKAKFDAGETSVVLTVP